MPQDHAFYDATQHYDSTPQPRPGASAVNSTIDGSQQTQHRQTQARGTNQNSQELTEDEDLWSFVDLLQQQSTAGPGSNQLNAPLSLLGDIIPPTTLNNTDVYHPIPWDASTYNLEPFSTHASGIQFPTHDGLDAHTCPADQLANTPPPMINIHPPFNYPGPPSNSSAPPVSVGPVDPTPASYFQALTHQQHSQASSPQPSAAPGLPQPTTSQKRRRSTSLADSIPRAGAGDDEDVYWQVPASHRARCPRTACPAPAPTQIPAPNLQGVIPLPHQNPQSSRLPQVIATVLPHRTERDGDGFEHLEPSPGLITSHDNQWSCVTASTPGAVGGAAAYPLAVPAASGLPSTPSPDPSLVHPQTFIRQPSLAPSVDSQGSYTPSVSQSASQGQAPAPSNHPARPRRARPPPLRQVPSAEPPSAGPSMRILDFRRLSAADAIRGTPQSSPSAYGSFPRTPVSAQGSNASYEAMIQDNRHMDFVRYPSATPSSAPPHRYSHAPLTPVDNYKRHRLLRSH
ncbi:hypothetical protein BC834DRAFT_164128 [Gloeopeniophorella convolvens]|nr:hypothetical protein BC834DRAFT_164128 [Gloeopeniophorella convolvens]